jgi:hypothetical protein
VNHSRPRRSLRSLASAAVAALASAVGLRSSEPEAPRLDQPQKPRLPKFNLSRTRSRAPHGRPCQYTGGFPRSRRERLAQTRYRCIKLPNGLFIRATSWLGDSFAARLRTPRVATRPNGRKYLEPINTGRVAEKRLRSAKLLARSRSLRGLRLYFGGRRHVPQVHGVSPLVQLFAPRQAVAHG